MDPVAITPATGTIRDSLFEDNFEEGILVSGAAATLERVTVTGTKLGSIDGQLGDGIAIVDTDPLPTSADITDSSGESGISNIRSRGRWWPVSTIVTSAPSR